jgi:regulatory protein
MPSPDATTVPPVPPGGVPSRREAAEAALASAERLARSRAAPAVPNPEVEHDPEPDPHSVARAIVLRQLTLGPRSRSQLSGALRKRGCADDVAQAVLDRMAEVGLVDDAAYAQLMVESRRRTKGLAGAALRKELRDKGVDDEVAAQALGTRDPLAERARAEELVERKLRTMAGLEPQVQARRLAAMLARKGYPADTAYAVVRDAVNAAPEHQRD